MLAQELYNALEKAVDCGMDLNAEIKIANFDDDNNNKNECVHGYYFSKDDFIIY